MTDPDGPPEAAERPEDPSAGWSRLHPLSPLLRGGRFLLAALAIAGQQGLRDASFVTLLAVLGAVAPIGFAVGFVSWRVTRYRLTDTELQIDSGVLQRRNRRVPLARLQSVDVVRSLAARVVGLAELRLEVAGGGDTEAPLSYLSDEDAERLRAQLLARAAGPRSRPGTGEPVESVLVRCRPGPS